MLTLDKTFEFRGQKVAWGTIGDGQPLVLVHGFPWSAQAWRNIAPWLTRYYQIFFYDMLGTGQSEKFEGQDVRECVQSDLLAELIAHWQLDQPTVVGHDFGGLATLRAHFVNEIDYGRLVLINAVAVMPSGSPFYLHVHDHETAFAGLPDYAHRALFAAYTQNAAAKPIREDARDIYAAPYRPTRLLPPDCPSQHAIYRRNRGTLCAARVRCRYRLGRRRHVHPDRARSKSRRHAGCTVIHADSPRLASCA